MSEIKTKIRTYNDVIDLFGEEKAADMLSEALDWSTIDPKNDKKNIMERKPLLLDPYMTYEGEDYCKHIVAGFLGDRDLDWASGYIDEEKIKNGQVMPVDLKSALSMALDNELSTSWAYLDALSSQCAEICNKFAGSIESAGLARGVLVPGEYELDHDALNADVSERFNIQYGFQCDQMIDAMQFDMTLILTEKVDSMDGYRLIQSVCDWREENLEVIEDAENNLDYGKVPSYVAYERPADIGTTIIDELCASQGTAVEKLVNYPTTKFERTMRDELFEALAVNETTISLMAKVPSSVFLDAVACMDSRYMSGHTVDTGHAFIVSPGTCEPYIGIHDPVYGAGYMMVDLDKPFEIPMNRIWIAMDDYSGPETKEGLRGMYHSPQDVSAFSDPFCGSVSVTPTRDDSAAPRYMEQAFGCPAEEWGQPEVTEIKVEAYRAETEFSPSDIMNATVENGIGVVKSFDRPLCSIPADVLEGLKEDVRASEYAGVIAPMASLTVSDWQYKGEQARWALDYEREHGVPPSFLDCLEYMQEQEKKDPDHGRRLSDKQAKVKTASDRLDAEREPKANIPIHDEESK